jgi:putative ABC transport system permease protein
MGTLLRDIRHAARMLSRQPGFAAAIIAVLALGIGANAAIFSLVNAFLLKPLVIDHAGELAAVYSRDTTKPDTYRGFSYPNYLDLRENNPVFTSLMAHNLAMVGVREGDGTRRVFADIVSSNFFETFGVKLFRGRTFTHEEERPGAGIAVAIISYPTWQKSGADPGLLGKPLRINGRFYTIVGIAPRGFTGTTGLDQSDVVPASVEVVTLSSTLSSNVRFRVLP